jgi:hypothetical protein
MQCIPYNTAPLEHTSVTPLLPKKPYNTAVLVYFPCHPLFVPEPAFSDNFCLFLRRLLKNNMTTGLEAHIG